MERYVHRELRTAVAAFAAVAVSAPVTFAVRGELVDPGAVPFFTLGLIACAAVATQLSRFKWLSRVLGFETAQPLEGPPPRASLRRRPLHVGLFAVMTALTLGVALAWEPLVALTPLWLGTMWLGEAGLAATWERANGKVLWRGHDREEPWRLSVSPRPPTRTASGVRHG
ncbi:hypothetical protein [Streptomyces sp. NPDC003832]